MGATPPAAAPESVGSLALALPAPVPAASGQPCAIEVENVTFSYDGRRPALSQVSLRVERGRICMVLGPSGSGKSTLLKAIKGLITPQQGCIRVLGVDVSRSRRRAQLGATVAYIPQHLGLVRNMTVLENTLMGVLSRTGTLASLLKVFRQEHVDEARRILQSLGIGAKAAERVYCLSGGERQRVAIARALMQQPSLVLADEFVSQLDPVTTREILALVREIADAGVAFLITSHEVDLVARFGNTAIFFREARKVHECPAAQVDLNAAASLMRP